MFSAPTVTRDGGRGQYAVMRRRGWRETVVEAWMEEMTHYGGHAPATAESAWERLVRPIADHLTSKDAQYLVAESTQHERLGVVGAELVTLGGAFAPKRLLHISMVYVLPSVRGVGIGNRLLTAILERGRARGCEAPDLTVVAGNPATSLYEKHGFSISGFKMVRPL
jgi:GNAT superfamily N-acetyltransferase